MACVLHIQCDDSIKKETSIGLWCQTFPPGKYLTAYIGQPLEEGVWMDGNVIDIIIQREEMLHVLGP